MRSPLSLFAAVSILAAAPALAQAMVVPLDHSERLNLQGSAASVVVGNPTIADVTVIDSHTVYVMGRHLGSTNVVVLDHAGRTLYSGDVTVAAAGANVSVYRGHQRSDVACNPGCSDDGGTAGAATLGALPGQTASAAAAGANAAMAAPHP